MIRLDHREPIPESLRGAILALGKFDGFHPGPQAVVGEAIAWARSETRPCIVADNDWPDCGFGAEVAARVSEKCFGQLHAPVTRISFAATPCPTVRVLENAFYPNAATIIRAAEAQLDLPPTDLSREDFYSHERRFTGPF